MTQKRRKRGFFKILAGCALAVALLLAAALPGLAASEATQDVLDTLAYLQRVSIQPEWLPDIQTNESAVQGLLDGYLALTLAERRELTAENRADLRAYFEALYQVQGKDVAGVDALFEDATAVPDASASSASAVASSAPASSAPTGGSAPDASAVSDPASTASVPAATSQPVAPPAGDGGFGRTLGTGLLMVLAVVAVVLFVRFLAALRRADRDGAAQAHVDARAQEMFGESYDPVDDPVNEDFIVPPPADYLDTAPAALPEEEHPPFDEQAPAGGSFAMFAPDNAPALKKESFFARRKREKEEQDAGEELAELRQEVLEREEDQPQALVPEKPEKKASPFAPPGGSSRFDKAFGGKDLPPLASAEDMAKEETPLPKEAEPLFTANPDRRNSITTRSFSAPRSGRPAKMTFRQGDPDDLDGVDE